MPVKESTVDVLVIGAGPAGVMAANALARARVNVRIVEKRPVKVMAGQADGIQPRTIEVLQSYGLAEPLLKKAAHMSMAAFYNPAQNGGIERIGRVPDVTAPTARFPFEVTLHQGEIEQFFLDSMRKEGLEVDRPIVPTALEISTDEKVLKDPTAYPVTVTLQRLDAEDEEAKTEIVRARFVIGTDGAHSWVRKACGISMDGEQTDFIWGVVDMYPSASTDFPDTRNRTAIHSQNGSCMIIPREGDKIRLYIQLSDTDAVDPATGRINLAKYGPERLMQVAKKTFEPYTIDTDISTIDWWTLYIIGQRVASSFSVHERVFIAGDACHTHSPKAGQGMNASMNDTHNLSWKLAYVLRGWADMSLLTTYEFERRKYAQDLIAFDKTFSKMFSAKLEATAGHKEGGLTHDEFLAAFQGYGNFTSGVGIHYAPSAITSPAHQSAASNLTVGQRILPHILVRAADAHSFEIQDMCPADGRFKMFVFLGELGERTEGLVRELRREGAWVRKAREVDMVDLITVARGKKETFSWLDVPEGLRPHWTKVLLDDKDIMFRGGGLYVAYGVSEQNGAIAIVRPDGYVGTVVPLDAEGLGALDAYFAGFMVVKT